MNCVSCGICVYHLWFVFFHGVFLSSRVTGACPVTTDLIMRVYVRTTTNNNTYCTKHEVVSCVCVYTVYECNMRRLNELVFNDVRSVVL